MCCAHRFRSSDLSRAIPIPYRGKSQFKCLQGDGPRIPPCSCSLHNSLKSELAMSNCLVSDSLATDGRIQFPDINIGISGLSPIRQTIAHFPSGSAQRRSKLVGRHFNSLLFWAQVQELKEGLHPLGNHVPLVYLGEFGTTPLRCNPSVRQENPLRE